jgi:hypothetical protein
MTYMFKKNLSVRVQFILSFSLVRIVLAMKFLHVNHEQMSTPDTGSSATP